MFRGVTSTFMKVCTGGRIILFWGVSPDFMALALGQNTPPPLILLALLCTPQQTKQD